MNFLLYYLALINLFSFLIMSEDKRRSQKGRWRIKESTFFILAFLGGAFGCILGMQLFRHKTKHSKFKIGMPFLLILNLLLLFYLKQIL